MSDAMTNRDIEDVLTSIRRLVAQEGGRNTETGRLILTEAQRIVSETSQQTGSLSDDSPTPAVADDSRFSAPLELTDPVMTEPESAERADEHGLPAPDFGQLEATIAELEAAVSGNGGHVDDEEVSSDDQEGDTVETTRAQNTSQSDGEQAPSDPHESNHMPTELSDSTPAPVVADTESSASDAEPSNVTALYGRLSFQHRRHGASQPADVVAEVTGDAGVQSNSEAPSTVSSDMDVQDVADVEHPDHEGAREPEIAHDSDAIGGETDTAEDTVIDEDMLRAVVAQLVREELHGQLGERITLQVRKLVRAEIAKALDERNYL